MKKIFFAAAMCTLFICSLAFSSVPLNKTHKGKTRNGDNINCNYCHKTAAVPKEGKDYKKYQKKETCQGSECHK